MNCPESDRCDIFAHMRYRTSDQETLSQEELLSLEVEEHNQEYAGRQHMPFGLASLRFSKEQVLRINDRAHKQGAYMRGYRKRRLFEMLDLPSTCGKRVLDVGCGNGQHAVFFAMYGAQASGFDLSDVGIDVARQMASENGVSELCNFQIADASSMPYPDETFDVVVLNAVLHHMLKYPNIRNETFRVLKPGGRVLIAEGLRENPVYRLLRGFFLKARGGTSDQGDLDLDLGDLLTFAEGFEDVYKEQFCLFEGIKAGIARPYANPLPVRIVLFIATQADRVVLGLLPFLRKYCSEIVMVMRKPA
jgi:2-polyprenyl-3-methyl-5-hydroxy-6-metoxy-1,4-benzoquinol methylase